MCAIDYADDVCRVWNEKTRIARTSHLCDECGRAIHPGESYQYVSCLYDGRWSVWKTCRHCKAAGAWLNTVCGGYLTGGLVEEMKEHWDEGYRSVGMGRLVVGLRRRWRDGADTVPDAAAVRDLARSMMERKVAA